MRGAIEPPLYIIWYHGAQQILPDNKHGYRMQMTKSDGNYANSLGSYADLDTPGDRKNTVSIRNNEFAVLLLNNYYDVLLFENIH